MHRNNRASIVRFIYIYCVLYQLYYGFASVSILSGYCTGRLSNPQNIGEEKHWT